jgi:hypothetical protein
MFQKIKTFAANHETAVTVAATAAATAICVVVVCKLDMIQHPEDYTESN